MLTNLLERTARLRRIFHRQHLLAAGESLAALGQLPLLMSAHRPGWLRAMALAVLAVYAARQLVRFARTHRAARQLLAEELLFRRSADALHFHHWLRSDAARPDGSTILPLLQRRLRASGHDRAEGDRAKSDHQERLKRHFRRILREWYPAPVYPDVVLLGMLVVLLLAAPQVGLAWHTLPGRAGVAALLFSLVAALTRLPLAAGARHQLDGYTATLAAWTTAVVEAARLRGDAGKYAHTEHYRAPAAPAPPPEPPP